MNKHGIVYHAYFIDFSIYHPDFSDVYTFNNEPDTDTPHPIDNGIAYTVAYILKLFFTVKKRAMIMVCDNMDGKEEKRRLLFAKWFLKYNECGVLLYELDFKYLAALLESCCQVF